MRRLSAFLMIAALVAVLVPSAALAGKPVPVVNTVTVTELNTQGTDLCALTVAITFTGRASAVRYTAVKNDTDGSNPVELLARGAVSSSTTFQGVTLGADDWSWKVQLLDRKGKPVGIEVQTEPEEWDGATCPAVGYPLASYPY